MKLHAIYKGQCQQERAAPVLRPPNVWIEKKFQTAFQKIHVLGTPGVGAGLTPFSRIPVHAIKPADMD